MYYAAIKKRDIANGIGVRVSLFVSGCTHHCKNCFNQETWDFSYGTPFTKETEELLLQALEPSYIHGLTLLGGEPLEPCNQAALLPFLQTVRARYPQKTIWCYTGIGSAFINRTSVLSRDAFPFISSGCIGRWSVCRSTEKHSACIPWLRKPAAD